MTDEFKKIIDEDIEKCKNEIEKGNHDSRGKLHGMLLSKYRNIISGFGTGLTHLFIDDDGSICIENLEIMKEKLILFKAMDYKNLYEKSDVSEITINNTNEQTTTINLSFDDVKKQVEEMTSLREEEIEEIHAKIDELEDIYKSSERKTKKWARAKEIIKWIADKGVDVGIALLPLLLKIGQA